MKLPLIDVDNKHNEYFPSFSFFNNEFKSGNRLIDLFSDRFSFHAYSSDNKKHIKKLDETMLRTSSNPSLIIIMSDASIKNHVTTSISHIHSYDKPVIKTLYSAINVTTTKAELFTIHCGINQVVALLNVNQIMVFTDSLHPAKNIFNSSVHSYQIHSAAIS